MKYFLLEENNVKILTLGMDVHEADDHQSGMPIELYGWIGPLETP